MERRVAELLDIPYRSRKGEAHKLVNTIFSAMTEAFWRGENVHIEGLGIFKVRTRAARNYLITPYPYGWKKGMKKSVIRLGPRKYVHFTPYQSIVKALNEN